MQNYICLILLLFVFVGCEKDSTHAARKFFNKNKIGSSTDYGVMKFGNDHVVSVHGFIDDLGACQEIVNAMNYNACKETNNTDCLNPYSCSPLNY